MKRLSLLLILAACAPKPEDFLDLTGTWSGSCDLPASVYTDTYTATVTMESLDEVDEFGVLKASVEGRPLTGDVEVDLNYDNNDETWGADVDGYTSEDDALYFETYDAGELWGLIITGTATGDRISGECLAGAWSDALDVLVWTTGSVSMERL